MMLEEVFDRIDVDQQTVSGPMFGLEKALFDQSVDGPTLAGVAEHFGGLPGGDEAADNALADFFIFCR